VAGKFIAFDHDGFHSIDIPVRKSRAGICEFPFVAKACKTGPYWEWHCDAIRLKKQGTPIIGRVKIWPGVIAGGGRKQVNNASCTW
jgi:hypothetical protein